jgi:hypothetical protein
MISPYFRTLEPGPRVQLFLYFSSRESCVCHDSAGFAVVITVIPWSHGKSCYPIGKTRGALTGTWHFEFPIGMGKSKSNEASVTPNGDHELPRSHLSFSAAHCTVCLLLVSYGKSDVPCQYAVQTSKIVQYYVSVPLPISISLYQRIKGGIRELFVDRDGE